MLWVTSFEVRSFTSYVTIPAILPLFTACFEMICSHHVVFICISTMSWILCPFRAIFSLGKSRGPNVVSTADVEPLECCALPPGMVHCVCTERRYRKTIFGAVSDELNFEGLTERSFLWTVWFMFWPLARNSWCTKPTTSKTAISIVLIFDWLPRGDDGVFHCDYLFHLRVIATNPWITFHSNVWQEGGIFGTSQQFAARC